MEIPSCSTESSLKELTKKHAKRPQSECPAVSFFAEKFPGICFEADTECIDKWVEAYNHFAYDGNVLTVDGIDVKKYDLVMAHMSPFAQPEEIAKETGLSAQEVTEIIETFC